MVPNGEQTLDLIHKPLLVHKETIKIQALFFSFENSTHNP